MQFDFSKDLKGDLTIVARGTESLMRSEVRAQKLMQFLQMTSNELDAPWVKRDYALRELAKDLDLDADKLVNDAREAALQAEVLKKYKEAMGTLDQPVGASMANSSGASGSMSGPPALSDPTGSGGTTSPGMSPSPGAEGFSGATPPNLGGGNAQ